MIKAIIFDVGGVLKKGFFHLNKDVYQIAKSLKRKGYKLAICSNTTNAHRLLNTLMGTYRPFSLVILSSEIGIRKPNPKIYQITLEKLKVAPSEAIFIDNLERNINAANKLGIHGILFKNRFT